MALEFRAVVHNTQTWLQSAWHVQVPFTWLEACVEWLQEEAGGAGRLTQQQINQQVDSDLFKLAVFTETSTFPHLRCIILQ